MAFQFSTAARNAWIDAIETTIGASPTLEIRTGAPPANCAAADSGTLLASMALPADFLAAAAAGSKAKLGTWEDASADAAGTAGHFRIKQGATCHWQGTVGATSSGADMELNNTNIAVGQPVTVSTVALNAGGA